MTNTNGLYVGVEAKYKVVSANAGMDTKHEETLRKAQTKSKLRVVGDNSQYANNINSREAYKLWADGIETLPALCDFDKKNALWTETSLKRWEINHIDLIL